MKRCKKMAVSFITVASTYHIAGRYSVLRQLRSSRLPHHAHPHACAQLSAVRGWAFFGFMVCRAFFLQILSLSARLAFGSAPQLGLAFAALVIGPFTLASANRQAGRRVLNLHLN